MTGVQTCALPILILGFGLTVIFLLISDVLNHPILLSLADYCLVNLCLIFLAGYILRRITGKAPGLFERPSSPAKWRASSIIKTRKGYGIWLDWLASASGYSASEINKSRCEDLVTQETVIAYVDYLERFCSSMTVYNRVQELYDAVVAMASHLPKAHWVWLKAAWKNLRAQATPSRNKLPRLKEADQLEALGLSLMQQAETAPERNYRQKGGLTALQRALMFRDGLMIALLIRRPFRIKNFYALSMGNNFLVHETGAVFSFKASDMKGKRSVEVPFPEGLLPYLDRKSTRLNSSHIPLSRMPSSA